MSNDTSTLIGVSVSLVLVIVMACIFAKGDLTSMEEQHRLDVLEMQVEKAIMRCDILGERSDELWEEVFDGR